MNIGDLINNSNYNAQGIISENSLITGNHKISIALTTFNGEDYIEEQLDSLLCQTITPYEIIICDDNSTDETVSIIKRIAKSNPQIKLYNNAQTLGINLNFQKAISLCIGEYIALSDQDDIWEPEKLLTQLKSILKFEEKDKTALLSIHDMRIISSDGTILTDSFYGIRLESVNPNFTLLFANNYWGCTMMFNKALKDLILPLPRAIYSHDHWITLNAFCLGRIIIIEDQLIHYRRHEKNFSKYPVGPKLSLYNRIPQYFSGMLRKDYYQREINQLKAFYDSHKNNPNLKFKSKVKSIARLYDSLNIWRRIRFTILYRLKM